MALQQGPGYSADGALRSLRYTESLGELTGRKGNQEAAGAGSGQEPGREAGIVRHRLLLCRWGQGGRSTLDELGFLHQRTQDES